MKFWDQLPDAVKRKLGALLLVGGGATLGGFVADEWLAARMRRALRRTKNVANRAKVEKMLADMGAPKGTPAYPVKGLGNAWQADISPRMLKHIEEDFPKLWKKLKKDRGRKDFPTFIAYDPRMRRRGLIAHEGAHVNMSQEPGWAGINQRKIRPAASLIGPTAANLIAAFSSGMWDHLPAKLRNSWLPALVGGGIGAAAGPLLSLPILLNEREASRRALAHLKDQVPQAEYEKEEQALDKAFDTYLGGSIATPALVGALSHGYYGSDWFGMNR